MQWSYNTVEYHSKQEIRSMERTSVQCCWFHTPLSKYLTVIVMALNQEGSRSFKSKVIVPVDSLWVVTYLTSTESNIVSLTVFEIFDIKDNYWTDLNKNFTTDVSMDEEGLVKFWKAPASGSGSRNFKKDSSALRAGHFLPQFGLYLRKEKWSDHRENFIVDVSLNKKVSSDPESGCGRDSPWLRSALSEFSCFPMFYLRGE